jgi:uncharacterized protein (DUF1800 family)
VGVRAFARDADLSRQPGQREGHPNENYARELMELHTLGVDGGYTQNDVMELARCLTGWTVKEHFWLGDFVFKEDIHDTGEKNVLGLSIQPNRVRVKRSKSSSIWPHTSIHREIYLHQTCASLHRR